MVKKEAFFLCGCGCGSRSETLGQDYIRLQQRQKWYLESCLKERPLDKGEIVRKFKGGLIVKEVDF